MEDEFISTNFWKMGSKWLSDNYLSTVEEIKILVAGKGEHGL